MFVLLILFQSNVKALDTLLLPYLQLVILSGESSLSITCNLFRDHSPCLTFQLIHEQFGLLHRGLASSSVHMRNLTVLGPFPSLRTEQGDAGADQAQNVTGKKPPWVLWAHLLEPSSD